MFSEAIVMFALSVLLCGGAFRARGGPLITSGGGVLPVEALEASCRLPLCLGEVTARLTFGGSIGVSFLAPAFRAPWIFPA